MYSPESYESSQTKVSAGDYSETHVERRFTIEKSTVKPLLRKGFRIAGGAVGTVGDVFEWSMDTIGTYSQGGKMVEARFAATVALDTTELVISGFVAGATGVAAGAITCTVIAATPAAPLAPAGPGPQVQVWLTLPII
jgi:hypothetical protein